MIMCVCVVCVALQIIQSLCKFGLMVFAKVFFKGFSTVHCAFYVDRFLFYFFVELVKTADNERFALPNFLAM